MAQVLVLTADLLFGSRVQGDLLAAGDTVELISDEARLRARLDEAAPDGAPAPDVLVVDLTDERLDGVAIVERLAAADLLGATGAGRVIVTLGYYAHVDADARARAERAGFDLVVPRSRMAREGAELVRRLAA